ncbi:MAG: hypothetical protein HYX63_16105 [Gammaproteobacteria bacterium]|nr:hypothetical protein [Gammaproteobacteria bacterium]
MFAVIRFSHAEDVTNRATRGVTDHHHPTCEQAVADHSRFTVVLARIFDLDCQARENRRRVSKI